jgi:hypothetical protein
MSLLSRILGTVDVHTIEVLINECLTKPRSLKRLNDLRTSHSLDFAKALELSSTQVIQELGNLALDHSYPNLAIDIEGEINKRLNLQNKVETPNIQEVIRDQLKEEEIKLFELQQQLIRNFYRQKTYFGDDLQRSFMNVIYSEVQYNELQIADNFKLAIASAIENGVSVEQILFDYAETYPLDNIEACIVTAILQSKHHPENVPPLDVEHPEYLLANIQADLITQMTDYELLSNLI